VFFCFEQTITDAVDVSLLSLARLDTSTLMCAGDERSYWRHSQTL